MTYDENEIGMTGGGHEDSSGSGMSASTVVMENEIAGGDHEGDGSYIGNGVDGGDRLDENLEAVDHEEVLGDIPAQSVIPEVVETGVSYEDNSSDWEDSEEAVQESPYDRPGSWYVVHTYAGYENKVKANLLNRAVTMNMEDRIYEVVIPLEDVVEFKNSKKVMVQKKVFPGYLLCRCDMNDDSWSVIRNTPGVTGFVGPGTKPTPLSRREVESIMKPDSGGEAHSRKGRAQVEHEVGDTVRVKEGPFADFSGQVAEINEDQLKLKVLVNIFGRETPVELEFDQVAKL